MALDRYTSDPALRNFVLLQRDGTRALVRAGYETSLGTLHPDDVVPTRVVRGGRAPHPMVELPGGERVLIRRYLRGGMVRHLNRDRYFAGHRALEELRVTVRARGAGVRAPEPLAAAERRRWPGYTARLATRWVEGGADLALWLARRSAPERIAALAETGRQVARMHAAGISHPDLNLRNFLVVDGDGVEPLVYVLDFDRARIHPAGPTERFRIADLRRLARSARKIAAPIDTVAWAALREGYGPAWPRGLQLR